MSEFEEELLLQVKRIANTLQLLVYEVTNVRRAVEKDSTILRKAD